MRSVGKRPRFDGDRPSTFPPLSYLLTKQPCLELRDRLNPMRLPDDYLFYQSNDLRVASSESRIENRNAFVLVAGLMIDTNIQTTDLHSICCALCKKLLISYEHFLEYADSISGRYIILYRGVDCSELSIINDATGMMKVLYCQQTHAVSSNIFLIRDYAQINKSQKHPLFINKRPFWKFGTIGDLQPLEGIKTLTANHALTLNSHTISRIFPRTELCRKEPQSVFKSLMNDFYSQLLLLRSNYSLLCSITSGIDSRVSMSLLMSSPSNNDLFFTYLFQDKQKIDSIFAGHIANKYDIKHVLLRRDGVTSGSEYIDNKSITLNDAFFKDRLMDKIKYWDWYNHGYENAFSYAKSLVPIALEHNQTLTPLHIRSNLYEIGRVYWGKNTGEIFDVSEILPKSRKDWAGDLTVASIFAEYFDRMDYQSCSRMGYNLLDIFYWEHRCATWVAEVLQGTDFAFNTHVFLNSRKNIDNLLSIGFDGRRNAVVYHRMIAEWFAELDQYPVNPKTFSFDQPGQRQWWHGTRLGGLWPLKNIWPERTR